MEITVRGQFEQMLIKDGMSKEQAISVMNFAIPKLNPIIKRYNMTFNRPSYEYPKVIYRVIYPSIKPIALQWIKDNKPNAWFKPMFE